MDDIPLIKYNSYIQEGHSLISYLLQEDGVTGGSVTGYHTGYYRPLINISYYIDYQIWGMNPKGFRTTSLILHVLSCFVLFNLLIMLIKERYVAFLLTLLFALHPVNTEAVSWITSRNNIVVTLFGLSSLYCYIRAWEKGDGKAYILSVFCFAGAIFSKEFGVVLFPVFILYQRLLNKQKKDFWEELRGYLPIILIIVFYFILRKNVIGSLFTPSEVSNTLMRIFFSPYLILFYLKLIFFPYMLHSFIIGYFHPHMYLKIFLGILFLILACLVLWKYRNNRIVIFSILSFFLALLPISNIIPTATITLISMRWLYFPMAFLFIAVSYVLLKLISMNNRLLSALVAAIMIYFGIYTYFMNKNLWHDGEIFFRQEAMNFNNFYYADGFAMSLLSQKKYKLADKYFQLAISHYQRPETYINYSILLLTTGRPREALSYLQKLESNPTTMTERGKAFNNAGMAYFVLKDYEKAINHFSKAVLYRPKEPKCWVNLGAAYGSIGNYRDSVKTLKKGLTILPGSIEIKKNLAVTYMNMNEYGKAIALLEKIPYKEDWDPGIDKLLKRARESMHNENKRIDITK